MKKVLIKSLYSITTAPLRMYYHPSSQVIVYDDTVKNRYQKLAVSDLQIGMKVVTPSTTSTSTTVTTVTNLTTIDVPRSQLCIIQPKRNAAFVAHTSLTTLRLRSCGTSTREYGEECILRLSDEELKPNWLRARFKLYRQPIRHLHSESEGLLIPPYILGFFVSKHVDINQCTVDCQQIYDRMLVEAASYPAPHVQVRRLAPFTKSTSSTRPVKVEFSGERWRKFLQTQSAYQHKLPWEYMSASMSDRASLMAGFLDNVGYMSKYNYVYEIFVQNEGLIEQIKLLAGSLGLHISQKSKMPDANKVPDNSARKQYKKLYISGDLEAAGIQCADPKKIPRPNKQVKVNSVGFDIVYDVPDDTECKMTLVELSSKDCCMLNEHFLMI